MTPENLKVFQGFLAQIGEASAQMASMLGVEASPGQGAIIVPAPKMVAFDFSGAPKFDIHGVVTEDFWMQGKPGAKKGALFAHWNVYFIVTSRMGGANEYDVVCAPDPNDPVQMNLSNYNSCVHHAWEPVVGWVTNPPPGLEPNAVVTDEIRAGWVAWDKQFKAAQGL